MTAGVLRYNQELSVDQNAIDPAPAWVDEVMGKAKRLVEVNNDIRHVYERRLLGLSLEGYGPDYLARKKEEQKTRERELEELMRMIKKCSHENKE